MNDVTVAGRRWLLGLGVLLVGLAVYLVDRPEQTLPVTASLAAWLSGTPVTFGVLGWQLPTFTHVFAFSMFSAAVLGTSTRRGAFCVVLAWLAVEVGFELGQSSALLPQWLHGLAEAPDAHAWLAALRDYFALGTFDPGDLTAAALGSAGAFAAILLTRRQGGTA